MLNAVKHLKMDCRDALPPYLQQGYALRTQGAC